MREIRTSGSLSGEWKRARPGTQALATERASNPHDRPKHRATPRLYSLGQRRNEMDQRAAGFIPAGINPAARWSSFLWRV
jgi:hypothetical protein